MTDNRIGVNSIGLASPRVNVTRIAVNISQKGSMAAVNDVAGRAVLPALIFPLVTSKMAPLLFPILRSVELTP